MLAHGKGSVKVGIVEHRGDLADRRRCQSREGLRQVVAVVAGSCRAIIDSIEDWSAGRDFLPAGARALGSLRIRQNE